MLEIDAYMCFINGNLVNATREENPLIFEVDECVFEVEIATVWPKIHGC